MRPVLARSPSLGWRPAVKWVEKIKESSTENRYTVYVVVDADARRLSIPLAGVSENDAAEMVATGNWKYVYER
jgi:hypothetical protein